MNEKAVDARWFWRLAEVVLPALMSVGLFGVMLFWIILPAFETNVMERRQEAVRELTQTAWSVLADYAGKERAGLLSRQEAQAGAIEQVRGLRYGPEGKDYFWINDLRPFMVVHPYRPDLEGQDVSGFTDPKGKHLFNEVVAVAKGQGSGFVSYDWQWKDEPGLIVPKLSFVKVFEPWGWVIGTGMYVEDVRAEMAAMTRKLSWVGLGILGMTMLLSGLIVRRGLRTEFERRRAEEALRASEVKYRELVENANSIILRFDTQGRITFFNEFAQTFFGYSEQEILGRHLSGTIVPETESSGRDLEAMIQDICLGPDQFSQNENENLKRNGERVWIGWTNKGLLDQTGRVAEVLAVGNDVTARRRAEQALRRERDLNQHLIDSSPAFLVTIDAEGRTLMMNLAMRQALGYSEEEVSGRDFLTTFIPQAERGRAAALFRDLREKPEPRINESRVLAKDGRELLVAWQARPVSGMEGDFDFFLQVGLDITERKEANEERLRLAAAIEQAAEAMAVIGLDRTIRYVNPAFERIYGYQAEEAVGQSTALFSAGPGEAAFFDTAWPHLERGLVSQGRMTIQKRDGSRREVELTVTPVRDDEGQIINYVALSRDMTHEVGLERQLRQAQKMEAIGTLAGGIAHDFNNILASLIGFAELARRSLPETAQQASQDLKEVLEAGNRAKDLVKQILTFSRQGEQEKRALRLGPVIKEALKLLRASLPTTIEIKQDIAVQSDVVLADATQVHQVLMNLCANAAYAMREKGGHLEVELREVDLEAAETAPSPELEPGPYLRLSVSDTGPGMDRAVVERIFEPYFTTKKPGEGTGMGLAVVHGIVKSQGGAITVESEPGQGATFKVWWPKFEGEVSLQAEEHGPLSRGQERILFVDDEEPLIRLWDRNLSRLGYTVTATTSSLEALEYFRAEPGAFDLVVTDQTMPRLTGLDLIREIKKLRPKVPVILCTGFGGLVGPEEIKSAGATEFVIKPFTTQQMTRLIRRVLDAENQPRLAETGSPLSDLSQ